MEERQKQIEREKEERMDEKAVTELEEQLQALDNEDDIRKALKSAQSRRVTFTEEGEGEAGAEGTGEDDMQVGD